MDMKKKMQNNLQSGGLTFLNMIIVSVLITYHGTMIIKWQLIDTRQWVMLLKLLDVRFCSAFASGGPVRHGFGAGKSVVKCGVRHMIYMTFGICQEMKQAR